MKNPKLTLLFLLFSIVLYSQKVIYYDTFENNKGNWESTNTNYKSSIHKGKLVIENSDPSSTKWHLVSAINDPDDIDFDIEAKIEVVKSEKDNSTYGLVWSCYTDNKYYDVVRMTPDKRVQLYEYQDGTFDYYKDWTTEKFINGYKKENKILVQKRANVVKIYINDKLYYQAGWYTYYGSKVGFILDAQMTIEVDELKVTEYPKKINVVETFNPNLKMEKLPTTVSSEEYEETNPVVSPDGKYLFVTRKDCPLNIDSNKDDIWYSEKDTKGNWTTLKNMGRPLNNKDYNFVISTSPDNNTFLLGNRYAADGISANGQGISISHRTTSGWEIPKDVVIKDYVNTNEYVGFFLSNDNQHLLMAVERPEGEGEKDLYVSFLNEDGTWTKPMSLGKVVNTFEEETNPFLASDGKTLYFSSKGHPGYGGYDLFVTKR